MLWGKCACCDKWADTWHFSTKEHMRRASWWSGGDKAVEVNNGSASAAADTPTITVTVRSAKVKVFYPTGWAGSSVDGAFLVDSFFYMKDGKTKVEYLPEMLADLWRDTGLVFMAVCSGGAALTNPTKWTVTFDELLDRVPASVRMIIPIVCGNDILVNWKVPTFRDAWATAAERLCEGMRAKSAVQFAVVGGSSNVWRYDKWMKLGQRELYDVNARQLAGVFSACGVHATTGTAGVRALVGVCCFWGVQHMGNIALLLVSGIPPRVSKRTFYHQMWRASAYNQCHLCA